jgi:hypothetical protein
LCSSGFNVVDSIGSLWQTGLPATCAWVHTCLSHQAIEQPEQTRALLNGFFLHPLDLDDFSHRGEVSTEDSAKGFVMCFAAPGSLDYARLSGSICWMLEGAKCLKEDRLLMRHAKENDKRRGALGAHSGALCPEVRALDSICGPRDEAHGALSLPASLAQATLIVDRKVIYHTNAIFHDSHC